MSLLAKCGKLKQANSLRVLLSLPSHATSTALVTALTEGNWKTQYGPKYVDGPSSAIGRRPSTNPAPWRTSVSSWARLCCGKNVEVVAAATRLKCLCPHTFGSDWVKHNETFHGAVTIKSQWVCLTSRCILHLEENSTSWTSRHAQNRLYCGSSLPLYPNLNPPTANSRCKDSRISRIRLLTLKIQQKQPNK